jgi:hypothetical protein
MFKIYISFFNTRLHTLFSYKYHYIHRKNIFPYFIAWVMFYHNIWKTLWNFFFLLTWFRLKTLYQGKHYNVYIQVGHYNVLSPTTIMQEKIKHENNCLVNQDIPLMVILLCLTHMYCLKHSKLKHSSLQLDLWSISLQCLHVWLPLIKWSHITQGIWKLWMDYQNVFNINIPLANYMCSNEITYKKIMNLIELDKAMHWKHTWQSWQHFSVAIKWSKLAITLVSTSVLTNIFIYNNVQYCSITHFIGANVLTNLMYTFLKILFHFVSINFVNFWNSNSKTSSFEHLLLQTWPSSH